MYCEVPHGVLQCSDRAAGRCDMMQISTAGIDLPLCQTDSIETFTHALTHSFAHAFVHSLTHSCIHASDMHNPQQISVSAPVLVHTWYVLLIQLRLLQGAHLPAYCC